jgi:hypothetical protein
MLSPAVSENEEHWLYAARFRGWPSGGTDSASWFNPWQCLSDAQTQKHTTIPSRIMILYNNAMSLFWCYRTEFLIIFLHFNFYRMLPHVWHHCLYTSGSPFCEIGLCVQTVRLCHTTTTYHWCLYLITGNTGSIPGQWRYDLWWPGWYRFFWSSLVFPCQLSWFWCVRQSRPAGSYQKISPLDSDKEVFETIKRRCFYACALHKKWMTWIHSSQTISVCLHILSSKLTQLISVEVFIGEFALKVVDWILFWLLRF